MTTTGKVLLWSALGIAAVGTISYFAVIKPPKLDYQELDFVKKTGTLRLGNKYIPFVYKEGQGMHVPNIKPSWAANIDFKYNDVIIQARSSLFGLVKNKRIKLSTI